MQKDQNSCDIRLVAYGSRRLKKMEQKYSQTEREALAIGWGSRTFPPLLLLLLLT